ncbi:MAG: hypothetical protein JO115_03990 [Pseudonocardiales bacterium]|nr:hypothetical protein [Pseudonocardiales bacterium]
MPRLTRANAGQAGEAGGSLAPPLHVAFHVAARKVPEPVPDDEKAAAEPFGGEFAGFGVAIGSGAADAEQLRGSARGCGAGSTYQPPPFHHPSSPPHHVVHRPTARPVATRSRLSQPFRQEVAQCSGAVFLKAEHTVTRHMGIEDHRFTLHTH